jgi:hypothetical protein
MTDERIIFGNINKEHTDSVEDNGECVILSGGTGLGCFCYEAGKIKLLLLTMANWPLVS